MIQCDCPMCRSFRAGQWKSYPCQFTRDSMGEEYEDELTGWEVFCIAVLTIIICSLVVWGLGLPA
jgi:hypothetical protein